MDVLENHTHSFIIKIWLEETGTDTAPARWRGYITHVPSKARHYLKDLTDIMIFVGPYLKAMGIAIAETSPRLGERHDQLDPSASARSQRPLPNSGPDDPD